MSVWSALFRREFAIAVRIGGGAMMGVLFFLIVVTVMPDPARPRPPL
jgi:heme exporter protein B